MDIDGMFEGWTSREINLYIRGMNEGLPPEECGVELNEKERASYLKQQKWLMDERKNGTPVSYSLVENDW